MQSAWTKNLKDPKEVEKFQGSVLSARPVLERLAELLDEKEAELDRSVKTETVYSNPNWAYLQAHKNGYSAALSSIKTLLDQ